MFDPVQWAANILRCGRDEAAYRLKSAFASDLSIGRDEHKMGGMGTLRRRASHGDKNAMHAVRDIDRAFAACDRARETGEPCKVCGPVIRPFAVCG